MIHANRNLGSSLDITFGDGVNVAVTLRDGHVVLGHSLGGLDSSGFQIVYSAEGRIVKVPFDRIRYVEVAPSGDRL